mmetsp:Transcript_24047/g.34389  ORF Transcript_24047/g.34389 Transcript_24047/m.34389 type:complete len:88 (-) Transcript_24047:437-700(-)
MLSILLYHRRLIYTQCASCYVVLMCLSMNSMAVFNFRLMMMNRIYILPLAHRCRCFVKDKLINTDVVKQRASLSSLASSSCGPDQKI